MLGNIIRWAATSRVLHLSMEHLAKDFWRTLECMNNFLGRGRRLDLDSRVGNLNGGGAHATKSYDNLYIESVLIQETVWGKEFLTARKAINKIYQRQVDLFDCPMP